MLEPEPNVMETFARMVPTMLQVLPSVTLVPIAQYTLLASAPFLRTTEVALEVINVVAIWNTN